MHIFEKKAHSHILMEKKRDKGECEEDLREKERKKRRKKRGERSFSTTPPLRTKSERLLNCIETN
jgi:hypothetical protein